MPALQLMGRSALEKDGQAVDTITHHKFSVEEQNKKIIFF